ncbi:MAG: tryptophan halogenase family protein [Pseudomonadota bacterium]
MGAVTSVVIVGGGTAGWITAGVLAARHRRDGQSTLSIQLIESPNIPIIGVGEGTWPTMRATLRSIGVSEHDFVRECDAAFKQGSKFCGWVDGSDADCYYHPFDLPLGFFETNLVPHWLERDRGLSFSQSVCPQEEVCEAFLAPKSPYTPEYAGTTNYAYHLNAGKFSEFLKAHCTQKLGVELILDDVVDVQAADNGDIASVLTKEHGAVAGDLFIDCTGFRSLLLGGHYGIGRRSVGDTLFADTAIAVQVPYADNQPIASQTTSTAQEAGWIWDIGLRTRRGVGHVFSSAHTTEEQASEALLSYVKSTGGDTANLSMRTLALNAGYRDEFWLNNCVAVGLSAGFLEPLEASAIVLIELSAKMIADQLPATHDAMEIVAKRFNRTFHYRWERIIEFLKLHYLLSKRADTAFWRDNRAENSIPASLQENLRLWAEQPPWQFDFDHQNEVFPAASYQYVLYGMGFRTRAAPRGLADADRRAAELQFNKVANAARSLVSKLPSHKDYLTALNDPEVMKAS